MIDTQLILIDGISGSGKSTTAQLLYLNLRRQGVDVDWFYEHEFPHPIYRADEVVRAQREGIAEPNRIHAKAIENWRRFTDDLRQTGKVVILESTFLQTGVGSMYLMGMEKEMITHHVVRTEEIIHDLHPVLIYFRQADVERALRVINERRGGDFDTYLIDKIGSSVLGRRQNVHDFASVIKIYREFRSLTDDIVAASSLNKCVIDNSSAHWEQMMGMISQHLGLEPLLNRIPYERDLHDFIGRYRSMESDREWGVAIADGVLYFDDTYQTKLVPKAIDVFYLEGNCIELCFLRDRHGNVAEVICQGNILDEPVIGTRWKKVC